MLPLVICMMMYDCIYFCLIAIFAFPQSSVNAIRAIFNFVGRTGDWSGLSPGNPAAHPSVKKTLYQPPRNKLKQEFPLTKLCHFSLTSLLSCAPNKVTECSFHPCPVGKVNSLRFTFPNLYLWKTQGVGTILDQMMANFLTFFHRAIFFPHPGDRSFYMAAPKLWNDLPLFIRNISSVHAFKKALKTHLLQTAFPTTQNSSKTVYSELCVCL